MAKRQTWPSIVLTLLALAIVYGVGTTFFTLELERLVERTLTPRIAASAAVQALERDIPTGIDHFLSSRNVRAVGYACFGIAILLALAGLILQRRSVALLSSGSLVLPIYAYFVLHMSFLAGLGMLTALWAPFWGDLVRLGDIAYAPYVLLVYPASVAGIDVRQFLAGTFISLGLLIFILGVLAWFYARLRRQGTADFWIYRFSRHPQYLGWILWSYGLMLRVALRRDTALGQDNPGASLPWVISSLVIVCVALSEEIRMRRDHAADYGCYSRATSFMLPLPRFLARLVGAPFRLITGKAHPETGWDLVWVFVIYLGLVAALSLPFVVCAWPTGGWATWPF